MGIESRGYFTKKKPFIHFYLFSPQPAANVFTQVPPVFCREETKASVNCDGFSVVFSARKNEHHEVLGIIKLLIKGFFMRDLARNQILWVCKKRTCYQKWLVNSILLCVKAPHAVSEIGQFRSVPTFIVHLDFCLVLTFNNFRDMAIFGPAVRVAIQLCLSQMAEYLTLLRLRFIKKWSIYFGVLPL